MDSLEKAVLAVLMRPMGLLYSRGLTATCNVNTDPSSRAAGCKQDMTHGMRSMARLAWPEVVLAHVHAGFRIQLAPKACICLSQLG